MTTILRAALPLLAAGSFVVVPLMSAAPVQGVPIIEPTAGGTVRDGLEFPKDGVADWVIRPALVQTLNVDRRIGPFEDRGIIEFNILALGEGNEVKLNLPVLASKEPYPFTIDVFTYVGDGTVSLGDFNAGLLYTSFEYSGASVVTLDVTSFIGDLRSAESAFAGFNFRYRNASTIPSNGPFIAFNSVETRQHGPPATLHVSDGGITGMMFALAVVALLQCHRIVMRSG